MMRTGHQKKPIFMAEIILQVGMESKIELIRHIIMGKNGYIRLT